MGYEEDQALTNRWNWVIECYSPLEMSRIEDGVTLGRAEGWAADMVLAEFRSREANGETVADYEGA